MKKLLFIAFALFLFPASAYSSSSKDCIAYLGNEYDLFGYASISSFYQAFEKGGITKDDVIYFLGSSAVYKTNEIREKFGIGLEDISDISFAVNSSSYAEKSGIILFINPVKDILPEIDKQTFKIDGIPALSSPDLPDLHIIKYDGKIIIANSDLLKSYIAARKKGSEINARAKEFSSNIKNKTWFVRWNLSEQSKKLFHALFDNDKYARMLAKNNPYLNAIYNLDFIEAGMDLSKGLLELQLSSDKEEDAEKLVMLSHFSIVTASFVVSFLSGYQEEQQAQNAGYYENIQNLLQKIGTSKTNSGVLMSLQLSREDNTALFSKIKESIEKNKAEFKANNSEYLFGLCVKSLNENDTNGIQKRLAQGLPVNYRSRDKQTLLTIACQNNDAASVSFLLSNKADINMAGSDDSFPIHIAVQNKNPEITKLLIENKADTNSIDYSGNTPLHIAAAKDLNLCKILISGGASINIKSSSGETPLHAAAYEGKIEIIKFLLSSGADKSLTDDKGRTAAQIAQESGHKDLVKLLKK